MYRHPRLAHRVTPGPVFGMVTQQVRDGYGEPFLLSQDEVAHRLAISRTTVWRLLRAKQLQAVRIGSRTFVTRVSVEDFVRRHAAD